MFIMQLKSLLELLLFLLLLSILLTDSIFIIEINFVSIIVIMTVFFNIYCYSS